MARDREAFDKRRGRSPRMARSLKTPGSPSSAFTTSAIGRSWASAAAHFAATGKYAPPRPRSADSSTTPSASVGDIANAFCAPDQSRMSSARSGPARRIAASGKGCSAPITGASSSGTGSSRPGRRIRGGRCSTCNLRPCKQRVRRCSEARIGILDTKWPLPTPRRPGYALPAPPHH